VSKNSKNSGGTGEFLVFFAFLAVMLLGLGLALSWLCGLLADKIEAFTVGKVLAVWIRNIAVALALIVPIALSFKEARARGALWVILWIVAAALVVCFYILSIV